MFTPVGKPRPLPFPLYWQVTNENTVDPVTESVAGSFVWPEDSTERVIFPLYLSLEEYVALSSAIDVGADLAYPEQYIEVIAMWMRQGMDICQIIADCISNPASPAYNAVRDIVLNDLEVKAYMESLAAQQVLSLTNRGQNLLKPGACDPDFIFNQASILVDLLHGLTTDLFEAIEVGTNALERASILSSAIPVFGQVVPVDELLLLADQLVEEVAEDYNGAYDEGLYDDIRCALFCLVKDECALSIDAAIAFYEAKLGEALPDDPWEFLQALIGYLNVGDFGTDAPVYAMHLLSLALIRVSSTVFGIDFGQLALRVIAAGDEGDNDWEILCTDCGEPADCYDLTISQTPFTVLSGNSSLYGTWVSGEGLKSGSAQIAFNWNVPTSGATEFIVTFNGPVQGTLNIRNQNGSQSAPVSISLTDTVTGSYTVNKSDGVMTTLLYIGFIPTGSTPSASPFRIEGICWS